MRRLLLDAFGGVGGATKGYQRAGWYVVSVDHEPQPDCCADEFYQDDAVDFINRHGSEFEFTSASCPCQHGCTLTAGTNAGRIYPQLIPATRRALERTGRPWLIENPPGKAPIRRDLMLCGDMFPGLSVIRHRNFELSGVTVPQPTHPRHRGRVSGMRHGEWFTGPYVAVYGEGGGKGTVEQWQRAMGIDWTDNRKSIAEAIPPAYTEYIGTHLLAALRRGSAA